ncbi:type II/IV secretion system ATPase subunit [Candidatus Woesearchaeota archaeon]|nr:type II/IV secretion system ATPase subunit [Candidatus Woesearchaeota archaeon]
MVDDKEGRKPGIPYRIDHVGEDTILKVDCEKLNTIPSIEDNANIMSFVVERLIENKAATKIVFSQKREYEYDYAQTRILAELASVYNKLIKQKELFSYENLNMKLRSREAARFYTQIHNLIFDVLKKDPATAYVELRRMYRHEKILFESEEKERGQSIESYKLFTHTLAYFIEELDKTRLITILKPYLAGHKPYDREVYRKIFTPNIKPDFLFTKLMATYPKGAVELDNYKIGQSEVVIFELEDNVQYLYHITPPEFKLKEEHYEILDIARNIISEHKPTRQEFIDPTRMREVFFNVGQDLIEELSGYRKVKITPDEIKDLTMILIRYTVGFGLIEVLLEDPKIQDITFNSPAGQSTIFLVHQDFGECKTNIIPTIPDSESWASKLRMISGRPLDEANPILDTEIEIPGVARARIGVIAPPLNPFGIAYAFRRHRDKPWTLPLFIKSRMISTLAAGLISFIVDGNRTILVAGTRSAGKTSVVGSLLVEIMRKYRIITIEDTLELPTDSLRAMGYNIQPMKVASAFTKGTTEVPADEGIRTTLRLGDSALIVGEVRSTEAAALYEAMRVGALANVVAGTIHGDSPYGVFDRVVNDLKVPKTSFKATDIIIVSNPIRSPDGIHKWRRVTQITEVRKEWEDDPLREKGFVDLMKYDSKTDQLEPTDDLINGDSDILKAIAGNVREWAGSWDAVWENITLRADMKTAIVKAAEEENNPDLLEAPFVIKCNDYFHKISEKVRARYGKLDSERILFEWKEWLKKELKAKQSKKSFER